MKKHLFLSFALCYALFGADDVFDLGVVEISTNKNATPPPGVEKISKSQMELNNAISVTDVAIATPGVSIKGASGSRNESMINVRGFTSTRVPIYIDGIPAYVPYDGNMDLGRFTTVDLSQIDISKGASSVLYGPNSLGGVINLVSIKPTKELEAELHYGMKYGSTKGEASKNLFDSQEDFRVGTKQEKFYLQVIGSFREGYNGPTPDGLHSTTDLSHSNETRDKKIGLKAGFTPNDTDEYSLTYAKQEGDKTGKIYQGKDPNSLGKDRYWYWPDWNKESWYFLSDTQFDGWYIKSKIYYDKFINELQNMANSKFNTIANGKQGWVSYYDDYSFGGGIEVGVDTSDNNIIKFAPSFKEDLHKERNLYPKLPTNNEPWQKSKDRMYSFAIEDTYSFSEMTSLTIGARYDKRDAVSAQEFGVPEWGSGSAYYLFNFPTKDDDAFNYQALLEHSFDDKDSIYASFAKKTYFPTLKERYSSRFGKNLQNPNLAPEQSLNYEIGYKRDFDSFDISSALFYSDISDKIEAIKVGVLEQNQNVGKAEIYGVELGANAMLLDNLKIGTNYTYMHSDAKQEGIYLTDIPKHKFFAYADLKLNSKFRVYLSEYGQTGAKSNSNGTYSPAGFAVTNLKLIYDATKNLSFDLGVENLFDKAYAYTDGYYENGRTFVFNARYKY